LKEDVDDKELVTIIKKNPKTLFHCINKKENIFHYLVQNKNPDIFKNDLETILNKDLLKVLCKETITLTKEEKTIRKVTPLHTAVSQINTKMVEYLIEYSDIKSDIEISKKNGSKKFYSILEVALDKVGSSSKGSEEFKILEILTDKKKEGSNLFASIKNEEDKIKKFSKKFREFSDDVKNLLREKYKDQIEKVENYIKLNPSYDVKEAKSSQVSEAERRFGL
jgi:hypothetical protein